MRTLLSIGVWVTAILIGGCSKDLPACTLDTLSCGLYIDVGDVYWPSTPAELGPDEIVVDATRWHSSLEIAISRSREPFGEGDRACNRPSPMIIHEFRVNAVLQGEFHLKEFRILEKETCGTGTLPLDTFKRPDSEDGGILVLRPVPCEASRLLLPPLFTVDDINKEKFPPVMKWRGSEESIASPWTAEDLADPPPGYPCPPGLVDALHHGQPAGSERP